MWRLSILSFFNDTTSTQFYPLSLHDALPISSLLLNPLSARSFCSTTRGNTWKKAALPVAVRSEEHTSELQSLTKLVCRLLLKKKKNSKIWRQDNVQLGGCNA